MSQKHIIQLAYSYIGVDVSKSRLDIWRDERHEDIPNQDDAIGRFVAALVRLLKSGKCPPPLVVLEASGSYERRLARALSKAGVAFRLVNPRQVRDYAKSRGQLAKTDRIDAFTLSQFGIGNRLEPRPQAPASVRALRCLEDVRAALLEDRKAWSNRLGQDLGAAMEHEAKVQIRHLERRISQIEKKIEIHVGSDDLLASRVEVLAGVVGIGARTASSLLAYLPELGSLNRKSAANLAGLAPHACDSGESRGKRMCWGGRRRVRCVLYMPTLTATVHNDQIRPIYQQLLTKGKPKKVALTAVMRRMVTHLNSLLKDHQHPCYAGAQSQN